MKKRPTKTVDEDGNIEYILNGKFHREDGPAVIHASGNTFWFINDKLHREGGPAIERVNGTKYWCINNLYHREDGPAVECGDGTKSWYLNGGEYSEQNFNLAITLKKLGYDDIVISSLVKHDEDEH